MSTEVKEQNEGSAPPANPPADELRNIKAEFSRKMDNLAATNQKLAEQLAALSKPTQSAAAPKKVSVFENEDEFAEDVVSRAEQRVQAKMQAEQAKQAKINTAIQAVYADFPEIGDATSDLHKRTTELLQEYPEDERNTGAALKAAALAAAAELDIKPKKKRQTQSSDDFSLGGSKGQGSRPAKKEALTADHLEVAELFGLNIKDAKVKANLEKRAKRDQWSRWSKPNSEE